MKLRPYQQTAVDKALDFFRRETSKDIPLIVAPTGAGKSLMVAKVAKELGQGVLVLNPSKELLEQNYFKFRIYEGEGSIYSASMNIKEISEVTFATIGSIKTKPEDFSHVRYILIDEAHLVPPNSESMFMSFLSKLDGVKVIGLTATPFRLKSYNDPFPPYKPFSKINLLPRERPRFFNSFLHVTQIKELYDGGFLCPVKYLPLQWDDSDLTRNSTGAEFSDKSIEQALKAQRIIQRLPNVIQQSVDKGRKHRIVFVKSIEDANFLTTKVPNSACVSSETPKKEREQIINDFKAGKIATVFNVGILTIGFDFPALDTIILARPTMSLGLYYQIIGRGIRPHESKTELAFVDMCGNFKRFGRIEELEYKNDEVNGWYLTNGKKILTGTKMTK